MTDLQMNGNVQAIVKFTLIPINTPKPTEAKNDIVTSITPIKVIPILDSTRFFLARKRMEKTAMTKMLTAVRTPLLIVTVFKKFPTVPGTSASSK